MRGSVIAPRMVGTTYSPIFGNLKSIPQVLTAGAGQGIKGAVDLLAMGGVSKTAYRSKVLVQLREMALI